MGTRFSVGAPAQMGTRGAQARGGPAAGADLGGAGSLSFIAGCSTRRDLLPIRASMGSCGGLLQSCPAPSPALCLPTCALLEQPRRLVVAPQQRNHLCPLHQQLPADAAAHDAAGAWRSGSGRERHVTGSSAAAAGDATGMRQQAGHSPRAEGEGSPSKATGAHWGTKIKHAVLDQEAMEGREGEAAGGWAAGAPPTTHRRPCSRFRTSTGSLLQASGSGSCWLSTSFCRIWLSQSIEAAGRLSAERRPGRTLPTEADAQCRHCLPTCVGPPADPIRAACMLGCIQRLRAHNRARALRG